MNIQAVDQHFDTVRADLGEHVPEDSVIALMTTVCSILHSDGRHEVFTRIWTHPENTATWEENREDAANVLRHVADTIG